jgi:penicillin-binding protein A
MRVLLRLVGLFGGLGLLAFGMFQRSEPRWLMCLWGGTVLLALGIAASVRALHTGPRKGVLNLALVFVTLFIMLTVQLLRTQFIYAESISERVARDDEGNVTGNVRPVIRSMKVRRGAITDRNGVQLAGSEATPDGYARRTYPIAQTADVRAFSNILGFSSSRFGNYGLEATWNSWLTGEEGQPLRSLQDDVFNRPHTGNNMQLTIDARLQQAVWEVMVNRGGGKPGSAVVLDPRSGAVLAMVSVPGYDPQALTFNPFVEDWEADNARVGAYWEQINQDAAQRPLINRPLQGRYAPGSTFKTVTAAAALMYPEIGDDAITCPDEYQPDPNAPPVINAVDNLASLTGNPSNLGKVYAYSCNTAFAQLGVRLGADRLSTVAERFHFYPPRVAPDYSPDFTDLPTDVSLLALRGDFLSRDVAVADTAFGQGQLLATPFQMALVAATVANNGIMPQAYLVERVTDTDGGVAYQHAARPALLRETERVLPPNVAAEMRELMRLGVTEGFGKAAAVPGQSVGGKSGSAQAGLNDPNEIVHAWFIAIAPVEQPRYAVAVMIENGRDGAGVGAAATGDVLRAAFGLESQAPAPPSDSASP